MKILIVEPDKMVRQFFVKVLEDAGHQVVLAGNGEGALFALQGQKDIELIISDVYLSDMCNYELARKVREDDPRKKLLLILDWPYEETVENEAYSAGFGGILCKPVKAEDLIRMVRTLVRTLVI